MKKDIVFIKEILSVFENDSRPFLTHPIIMDAFKYNNKQDKDEQWLNKYYHHVNLLFDTNCILTIGENPHNIGITVSASGSYLLVNAHMRLTDNGHNMIMALNNDTIWKKLLGLGGKITAAALIKAGEKITEINIDQIFS